MSRKSKVVAGVVIAAVLLGCTAWKLMQPRFRFATRAQVEAVIDKRLLETLPASEPGKQEKLERLLKSHQGEKIPDVSDRLAYRAWATRSFNRNKPLIVQLIALYESGPVHRTQRNPFDVDFPNFSTIKQLVKYCAIAAEGDQAHARTDAAIEKLALACRLTDAYSRNSQTVIEYLVGSAILAISDASIGTLVQSNKLSSGQLQRILAFVKPFDPDFTIVRRSLVGDFQNYTLRMLPDLMTTGTDAAALQKAAEGLGSPKGEPQIGSYDAVASAKIASRIATATLDNIGRPYSKLDRSVEPYRKALVEGIPQDDFSHLSDGPEKSAKEFWYRVRMNNADNSIGRSLFAESSIGNDFLQAALKRMTEREALRGLVALTLYATEKGFYPYDLQQVSAYVEPLPRDYMSGKPLRYRVDKLVIYSVGVDLADDGGLATAGKRPFASLSDDWVYNLPSAYVLPKR